MKRSVIPVIAFLILLLLSIPFSLYIPTSGITGWHTTIIPRFFFLILFSIILLIFVIIGHWIYFRRNDRLDWILFSIHFVLTIPTFIYLQIPFILLDVNITNINYFLNEVVFRIKLIPLAWTLFIAGQTLFLFYYFRIIKKQKATI
jgi:hypothetical protein